MLEDVFFDGWEGLARTLAIGVMAYVVMITFLRISGKRTLSKMNAFDLIVTVALGSTLATVLLSKDVALAEGAVAFAVLIGLQFIVTWSSVRARWVRKLVTGEPRMLYYRGELLSDSLRKARVTVDEVEAAVRSSGMAALDDAESVVLETDGSFSVIKRQQGEAASVPVGVQAPASE